MTNNRLFYLSFDKKSHLSREIIGCPRLRHPENNFPKQPGMAAKALVRGQETLKRLQKFEVQRAFILRLHF